MTRGISEEMLVMLRNGANKNLKRENDYVRGLLSVYDHLVDECKELNPWMPIETAPKDRKLMLLWPELGMMEGEWVVDVFWCDMWELTGSNMGCQPTHWQELPEPPKE